MSLLLSGSSAAYTPPSGTIEFGEWIPYSIDLVCPPARAATPANKILLWMGSRAVILFSGSSGVYFAPSKGVDFGRDDSSPDVPAPEPAPGLINGARVLWSTRSPNSSSIRLQAIEHAPRDLVRRMVVSAPQPRYVPARLVLQAPVHRDVSRRAASSSPQPTDDGTRLVWSVGTPRDRASRVDWADSTHPADGSAVIAWNAPPPKDRGARVPFQSTIPARWSGDWFQAPNEARPGVGITFNVPPIELRLRGTSSAYTPPTGVIAFVGSSAPRPPAGDSIDFAWAPLREPVGFPQPADYQVRAPWTAGSARDGSRRLRTGPPQPRITPITIPWPSDPNPPADWPPVLEPAETYFVSNTFNVIRLPDRTDITGAVLGGNLSIDRGSWCWSGQLAIGTQAAMDLLNPTKGTRGPKTIQVTVNGFVLVLAVTQYSRGLAFGQRTWVAQVKSVSAFLADPYAPVRSLVSSTLKSAAQLATDELSGTGWTLDWGILDWNLAAGQWSYQGLAPINAICTLAAGAGAIVQTDPSAQILHVLSKYPVSPKDWAAATPDFILPAGVVKKIGGQWAPGTDYNAVQVTGGNQGVTVNCTRTGTAGDQPMQPITDPLIVDPLVGQERGRVELDSIGDAELADFDLPIMDPIGVRLPGQLGLVYEDADTSWRGVVWQTTINFAQGSSGSAGVSQTLKIEGRP